jgi:hypothetical protein
MNRSGCFGLVLGGLVGLLAAMILLVVARQSVSPVMVATPVKLPPADVNLFLSERSASRFVSTTLNRPALVEFEPGRQMLLTTRAPLAGFEPVIQMGISLQVVGMQIVSQLEWIRVGFIRIPAAWLPQSLITLGDTPGQIITRQAPVGFNIVGLTTTAEGVEFALTWVGS